MYYSFVKSKETDYLNVRDKRNEPNLRLLHAVLGIQCEFEEYMQAYDKGDKVNLLEELGDLMFYAHIISDEFCFDLINGFDKEIYFYQCKISKLLEYSLDAVKKQVFHVDEKSDYKMTKIRQSDIADLALYTLSLAKKHCEEYGIKFVDLLEMNMAKLDKRYKSSVTTKESDNRNTQNEMKHFPKS